MCTAAVRVALWERSALGIDSGTEDLDRFGWGGVTLAVNVTGHEDGRTLVGPDGRG